MTTMTTMTTIPTLIPPRKKRREKEGGGEKGYRIGKGRHGCHPMAHVCTDASPTVRHHWMKEMSHG